MNDRGLYGIWLNSLCGYYLPYLIAKPQHRHSVSPGVLESEAGLAVRAKNQRETLVKPAVDSISMKHHTPELFLCLWGTILEAHHKHRLVDDSQRSGVRRIRFEFCSRFRPAVAVQCGKNANARRLGISVDNGLEHSALEARPINTESMLVI